jgi:DNA replication and repair protein RecF
VELASLRATGFRNLESVRLDWSPGCNLVCGANGQGKTNLLEAIAVLGNLRSFRSGGARRLVRHGVAEFTLEGQVVEGSTRTALRQEVIVAGGSPRRTLFIDDQQVVPDLYLPVFPVVAMSPEDRELVVGEPAERRALLDRFAYLLEPAVLDEVRMYRRSLRQRNAALEGRDDQLGAWERGLAGAAARLVARRRAAVGRLRSRFAGAYADLAPEGFPEVTLDYRTESWLDASQTPVEVEEMYVHRYNRERARDRRMGHTLDGPHRHDLAIRADGRPARDVLSSGQTKVVAAALRLAMLEYVEHERQRILPVIVDDIDAELDRSTLDRVVRRLGMGRQVFLSSAHGEAAFETPSDRQTFVMEAGRRLATHDRETHG